MVTTESSSQLTDASPVKMTTRSGGTKRQPSVVSDPVDHQPQHQQEDSRDPHDHESTPRGECSGRDPSPPSNSPPKFKFEGRDKAAAAANDAAGKKKGRKSKKVDASPADVATPSFEQVLGPSGSFGLAMGSDGDSGTVLATNATGTPTSRQGGHPSHFRNSSNNIPANLPMSELDNPAWDLLNQDMMIHQNDSFGFNLAQGSLSFEMGEDTPGKGGNTKDKTSAVATGLDDNGRSAMDWSGGDGNVIVNSANHNWIPPGPEQPFYNGGYYGGGEHAEMRDNYDDPFKYAFGDPQASNAMAQKPPKGQRSSRRSSKGGRSSRRSKKRKQLDRAEPLDGHHSPPALPTIESAPTGNLEFPTGLNQDGIHHAWSASPGAGGHRKNSPPTLPEWRHGPGMGPYGSFAPPMPAQNVHNAFMPPMPAQPSGYPSQSGNGALPREVYITTKSNGGIKPSGRAGSSYPGANPFGMPPPYAYPPAPPSSGAPPLPPLNTNTKKGSTRDSSKQRSIKPAPGSTAVMQVRQPNQPSQRGVALLTLPNGSQLTREQAPGIGWPPEEDLRLTEVMSNHKSSTVNWKRLAIEHGQGRTARECHDRWTRYLKPGSRKGQWREEEDAIVLRVIFASGAARAAADKNGSKMSKDAAPIEPHPPFTQWADLAPQLPGRTGKQIRDRWVNYLNPAINHLPFSREDDLRLWQGHTDLGKRWVEISVKVFHSTRSENHIKNRWYSAAFKKFISKEFGIDAYCQAKQAQGGVPGGVVASAQHGPRSHPSARRVHGPNLRNTYASHQAV